MDAGCPMTLASRIAKLFWRKYHSIAVDDSGVVKKTIFSGWGKCIVIGLDDIK